MEIVKTKVCRVSALPILLLCLLMPEGSSSQTPSAALASKSQSAAAKPVDAPTPRPVRVIADLSGFHLDQGPVSKRQEIAAGSRGSSSKVTLCAPSSGITSSARPLFEWRAPDAGTSKLTFSLLDESGDVLYENDVSGTTLQYPADAPALQPGQSYRWKVAGREMNTLPDPVVFMVQGEAARKALLPLLKSTTDPLAHAQVFLRNGLWYDTVASLKTDIEHHPESAGRRDLQDQLSKLYQQVAPSCEMDK